MQRYGEARFPASTEHKVIDTGLSPLSFILILINLASAFLHQGYLASSRRRCNKLLFSPFEESHHAFTRDIQGT